MLTPGRQLAGSVLGVNPATCPCTCKVDGNAGGSSFDGQTVRRSRSRRVAGQVNPFLRVRPGKPELLWQPEPELPPELPVEPVDGPGIEPASQWPPDELDRQFERIATTARTQLARANLGRSTKPSASGDVAALDDEELLFALLTVGAFDDGECS